MCQFTTTHQFEQYINFGYVDRIAAFREKSGFYPIIRAIDCMHFPIQLSSHQIGEGFRNQKGFFSMNVQTVCDSRMHFTQIVTNWPGAVHDSRIFNYSILRVQLEDGLLTGILLGDFGHGLFAFLATPFAIPKERRTPQQQSTIIIQ